MRNRLFALLAFLLALIVPRLAAAQERVHRYEVDVWPDDATDSAKFRLRLEYVAPVSSPKTNGFKYFGSSSVDHWSVTGEDGAALHYTASKEATSGEWRLDFSVPAPSTRGGPQVVFVELTQDIALECGFASCFADVPWAHKFKIPVDHMVVRVHGDRAVSGGSFECTGAGSSAECIRESDAVESLAVPLRKQYGATDAIGAVLSLVALGVGISLLLIALRVRRERLLRLRGVIPPAAVPAYPPVEGYRAPAVIPVAADATPQLAPEDASSQRSRATRVVILAVISLLVFAVGVHTRMPMTMTMLFATVVVFAFATIYAGMEKGGTWLLVAPLFTAATAAIGGPLIGLAGIAVGVVGHLISIAPPGAFQGSGSSSSSCGGGGGGGGCGGGGGGGGGGCGG